MGRRKLLALLIITATVGGADAQESAVRPADTRGGPVDPTENVKALNAADARRQDDLRSMSERLLQAQLDSIDKLSELRDHHAQALAALRAEYDEKLRTAEKNRIDAIRTVDVNAVAVASARATDQATVLATQVSKSAEDLRALVATTAATALQNQQQQFSTLSARLTTLEQAGYQQAGKQTISDPALIALNAKVDALVNSRNDIAGRDTGRSDVFGWLGLVVGVLIGVGGLFLGSKQKSGTAR
jgi:hypothetical protein